MKIFMTGTSGFIGSHLKVVLEKNHELHHMVSDLLDFDAVTNEVIDYSPDVIVHLAARTEVEKSFYEQITFSQINYVGSVNLIEAASKVKNLKNFVFASTMEVFGWQPISDDIKNGKILDVVPTFDENTIPHPNAPYAVAKFGVEKYLEYAHRSLGLPFSALRQTNSYGRKDNDFFVVEQVISQMLKNPNEVNLGYGSPYRNFLYVSDLLNVWETVITNPDKVNNGQIFTIGPNNAIRISELVKLIADKLNWAGEVNWDQKPKRPGEIYLLNSNTNLINKLTGWEPKVSLSDGLDATIDIWKNIIKLDK